MSEQEFGYMKKDSAGHLMIHTLRAHPFELHGWEVDFGRTVARVCIIEVVAP